MVKKVITWVDLQGRYRVTSPAYNALAMAHEFDEDAAIAYTWAKLVRCGGYGISDNHTHFLVEDVDQRLRVSQLGDHTFRYVARPDANGNRTAVGGAWEMDVDGRPQVNMVKARAIQAERVEMLIDKKGLPDKAQVLAAFISSLGQYDTPLGLMAAWPSQLIGG